MLVLIGGACSSSDRFERNEVEAAFAEQGFNLQPWDQEFVAEAVTILAPKSDAFLVVIYADEDRAQEAIKILESQKTVESFDARRGNVVVIADDGLPEDGQTRVRTALQALD